MFISWKGKVTDKIQYPHDKKEKKNTKTRNRTCSIESVFMKTTVNIIFSDGKLMVFYDKEQAKISVLITSILTTRAMRK